MNAAVHTRQMRTLDISERSLGTTYASRLPIYCEQYPAMVPPTIAPQFPMIVAFDASELLNPFVTSV